jgi:hypothetical protein
MATVPTWFGPQAGVMFEASKMAPQAPGEV